MQAVLLRQLGHTLQYIFEPLGSLTQTQMLEIVHTSFGYTLHTKKELPFIEVVGVRYNIPSSLHRTPASFL